ncbi:MAG: hypothetical protein M5R41_18160 [Bacteroidia bacterium]|nr:hypothetical protein [Bacteroidia bacterium]
MKVPTSRILPLLSIAITLVFSACSDDDSDLIEHHFNPQWSPDGSTVVAAYVRGTAMAGGEVTGPGSPAHPGTELAILTVNTRSKRIIDLAPLRTQHALYEFDPSGTVLLLAQDGRLSLVDLNGTLRGSYNVPGAPQHVFARFVEGAGNVVLCASGTTQLEVRRLLFDPTTWSVIDDSLLMSAPAPAPLVALTPIGRDGLALRFENGVVRAYSFDGTLLHSFTTDSYTTINAWHQRMVYFQRQFGSPLLYVMEKDALSTLDLSSGAKSVLVTGQVIDMDVSDERNALVYETKTGDVWLSSVAGLPLSRIAPQNLMPRFSADGAGIATVERLNTRTDSLRILRFF